MLKLQENQLYKIDHGVDQFIGKFIEEKPNYYIFEDLISKKHKSVQKYIDIEEFYSKSNIYSVQNELFECIVGQKEMKELHENLSSEAALISIYNPNEKPLNLFYFRKELYIDFHDTDSTIGSIKPISSNQAKKIAKFIYDNIDRKFAINCEYGISRSAGVGMAVECIVNHNGDKYEYLTSYSAIKDFPRYMPNLTVFNAIIEEYNLIKKRY